MWSKNLLPSENKRREGAQENLAGRTELLFKVKDLEVKKPSVAKNDIFTITGFTFIEQSANY